MFELGQLVQLDSSYYRIAGMRRGGMATVLLMEREGDGSNVMVYKWRVACKIFDRQRLDDKQLTNELNIWIGLKHKNIVPLLSVSHLNYKLAAVMPQYAKSVRDLLEKQAKLAWADALMLLSQVSDALDYASLTAQIVHLDIKPENVLCHFLSSGLEAHLSDWGIATVQASFLRSNSTLQDHSHTYAGFGTLPYMAPERLIGGSSASTTMDVFSLGIMIYECLVGRLPYQADNPGDLGLEIVQGRYIDIIRASSSLLGRGGVQVIEKALNPMADKRYGSAREFYSAMRWAGLKNKAFGVFRRSK